MNTAIIIYFSIGFLATSYVVLSHLYATWKYIKQLYTAKYVRPNDIKTFFGFKYWSFSNSDFWIEVVCMSTLFMFTWAMGAFVFWPGCIVFFLNNSIQKARKRIENGD